MSVYASLLKKEKLISVTGLGYVGLPLALEFAKHFKVIAFDINESRVAKMKNGIDPSNELNKLAFEAVDITFTSDALDLASAHFHVICVPTDIDKHRVPDLNPLLGASISVGRALKPGDYVVYESTVYPGCTEEDCLPVLTKESGLSLSVESKTSEDDFHLGYSPERVVPGNRNRSLTSIIKIVSGHTVSTRKEIAKVYGHIITAGIYNSTSIKVAEAAKVIENTQRDTNISLMNELAIIFDKIGIETDEVIDAAKSKWNFHPYSPGLVGGHCIGVDPYLLIHKAKKVGYDPQVIAAGRRVNDHIPQFIAKKVVTQLIEIGKNPGACKVLIMGATFKEDVADIRNSKVFDLIVELSDYLLEVYVTDPYASSDEVTKYYGIQMLTDLEDDYDAIIVAVGHTAYKTLTLSELENLSKDQLLLFDIKGIIDRKGIEHYWKL